MTVSTKQQRIAELAKQQPEMSFTSLNHYLEVDWLREAYRRLRKDSAPGYDGQTVADYGKDLETNLQSLLNRAKSGTYFAPPVRRVHIRKGRVTRLARLGFQPRQINCFSVPSQCSWNPFMSRIFWTAHMDSVRVVLPMEPLSRCGASAWREASNGSWIWISPSFSTPWSRPIFGRFSSIGCVMV
jgi:hypothetical protein